MLPILRSGGSASALPLSIYGPSSIFNRVISGLPAASNQIPAKRVADQMAYNSQTYTHWYGYTGPGYALNAKPGHISAIQPPSSYAPSLYKVPATPALIAVQKVTVPAEHVELQEKSIAVPMPIAALVPSGDLITPEGTDGWFAVWQPSTDRYWEFWRLVGKEGEYSATYGGFYEGVSNWNGIFTNGMGTRATGLALLGGMISIQDIIEVLRGGSIKHALAVGLPVTEQPEEEGPIAPATRHDHQANNPELIPAGFPKEGEKNPSFGTVDGVAESSWFRLNPAAKASEYGIEPGAEPLATAIFKALQQYGFFVADSGGPAPHFNVESMQAAGSPYFHSQINPFPVGVPVGWTPKKFEPWFPRYDATLPKLKEEPETILAKFPWQLTERIEPRSS